MPDDKDKLIDQLRDEVFDFLEWRGRELGLDPARVVEGGCEGWIMFSCANIDCRVPNIEKLWAIAIQKTFAHFFERGQRAIAVAIEEVDRKHPGFRHKEH